MKKHLTNDEFWNVISHGLGIVLSLVGAIYLTALAVQKGTQVQVVAIICFSLSMITLYTASTFYHLHSFRKNKDSMSLKRFDHIAIYYLIAGTYTPFTLMVLQHHSGYYILGGIWLLALIGTIYKVFFLDRYKWVSLSLYLFMGWLILLDMSTFIQLSSSTTLWLLVLGGVSYTIGTFFYANNRIPYNHPIWHGLVLTGTIFHYFSILWLFE